MEGPWPSYVSLAVRRIEPVRYLPGFRKSHQLPTESTDRTRAFIAQLANPKIQGDLDRMFQLLRTSFHFRRQELLTYDEDGSGSITTPHFLYESAVSLNPQDVTEIVWLRAVSHINDASHIVSPAFEDAFGAMFDTVEFRPPEPIDLESFVDRIEAIEDERVMIDYDRRLTNCQVTITGFTFRLNVSATDVQIMHPRAALARELVGSLLSVQGHAHRSFHAQVAIDIITLKRVPLAQAEAQESKVAPWDASVLRRAER